MNLKKITIFVLLFSAFAVNVTKSLAEDVANQAATEPAAALEVVVPEGAAVAADVIEEAVVEEEAAAIDDAIEVEAIETPEEEIAIDPDVTVIEIEDTPVEVAPEVTVEVEPEEAIETEAVAEEPEITVAVEAEAPVPVVEEAVTEETEKVTQAPAEEKKEAPPLPKIMLPVGFSSSVQKVAQAKELLEAFEKAAETDAAKAAGLQLVESTKTFIKIMFKLLERELSQQQKDMVTDLLLKIQKAVEFLKANLAKLDNVHQSEGPIKGQMMDLYMELMIELAPLFDAMEEARTQRMLVESNPEEVSSREELLGKRLDDIKSVIQAIVRFLQPKKATSLDVSAKPETPAQAVEAVEEEVPEVVAVEVTQEVTTQPEEEVEAPVVEAETAQDEAVEGVEAAAEEASAEVEEPEVVEVTEES